MSEPYDEPELVRQPDFSKGEKAIYGLDEMIGLIEDLRVEKERVNAREVRIAELHSMIEEIGQIASATLEDRSRDPWLALIDVVSRANRAAQR